jgi:hypothetical protein
MMAIDVLSTTVLYFIYYAGDGMYISKGSLKKLFDPYLTTLTVLQKEWLLFAAFLFKLFLRTYTKVPWDACNFCVRELFGFLAAVCLSLQLPFVSKNICQACDFHVHWKI